MALRSVSTAPTPAANAAGSSSGAPAGIAALLGGAPSPPGTTAPMGASAGGAAGTNTAAASATFNFLQLLAQANTQAAGIAAKADPKAVTDAEGKISGSKSSASEDQDPNAIAAALALLSQYMSSPPTTPSTPGNAPASATPPPSSPATDAAASMAAAATAGSAATGKSGTPPATDAKAKTTSTVDSMKSALASLLAPDTDSGVDATPTPPSATSATSPDSTSAQGSNSDATSASSTTATPLLNSQATANPHFAAQTDVHRADVKSPVGTSAWADELGGKITWMAKQGIESASLRLSPEHLGPVEVHISVQDGATSVTFGAAQADTRTALEQALPRLREMFANQGLTLADAGVSREPPRQPQTKPPAIASISGVSGVSVDGVSSVTTALPPIRLGLLDTYA